MSINVKDYGAKGDTTTDDTKAFQDALDEAGKTGDSVFVPVGTYCIKGTLNVPAYVVIEGDWKAPPYSFNKPENKGSILLAYKGMSDINGPPFITLAGHSAGLKGLTIYYPDQGTGKGRVIAEGGIMEYPVTIRGGFGLKGCKFG